MGVLCLGQADSLLTHGILGFLKQPPSLGGAGKNVINKCDFLIEKCVNGD